MSNDPQPLLPRLERGRLFVVSAPAGTGKNTLVNRLLGEFATVEESISCTTRQPREGERDGDHYHFLSEEAFVAKVEQDAFLEHVHLFDRRYGTLRASVEERSARGLHTVLVIDTQGGLRLMDEGTEACFIFVQPPSLDELRKRLLARQTESEADVEKRLGEAAREMEQGARYEYQIVNDDLDTAYEVLRSVFIAEAHRVGGSN